MMDPKINTAHFYDPTIEEMIADKEAQMTMDRHEKEPSEPCPGCGVCLCEVCGNKCGCSGCECGGTRCHPQSKTFIRKCCLE